MVIAIVDAVDKYFVPEQLHQGAIEVLLAVTRVQRYVMRSTSRMSVYIYNFSLKSASRSFDSVSTGVVPIIGPLIIGQLLYYCTVF